MARISREDKSFSFRLDELEQRMHALKIIYDKYFSGLEQVEPVRERDDLKRFILNLQQEPITNNGYRFKFQNLKARFASLEMMWTRNLVQIERGTHPKMAFRMAVKDRQQREIDERKARAKARREATMTPEEREERAYAAVYESYIEARRQVGQSTAIEYESVKSALQKQVRLIKSQYRCNSVKFRVSVEEGQVKLKAVPQRE